ncbi:MAG: class I SAM-dependent methyltransferase [Acidobacteriota bacterium]
MIGRLAGRLYGALAAPFGMRALERMLRDGLADSLGPPLRFLFTGQAAPEVLALAERIEARRAAIASRGGEYRTLTGPVLSSQRLANSVSVPRRWGVFLHLCARQFHARAIVELGACAGISGAYLASAPSRPRFVTIEGSPSLVPVAEEMLASFNATIIGAPFDAGLPRALTLVDSVDVAYIDGHHDEAPTLHYVRTLVPHLSPRALLILDDIRLYDGMRRAWRALSSMSGVSTAVDTGRFGLLVWEGGAAVPRHYDLARYTGIWRTQQRRAATAMPRAG